MLKPRLFSPLSSPLPPTSQTAQFCGLLALATGVLCLRAFGVFFAGEDFITRSIYFGAGEDFFRAINTSFNVFYRPTSIMWSIGSQLLLPWIPLVYHLRNLLMLGVAFFLLARILERLVADPKAKKLALFFFAVSHVHLTLIGLINLAEMIANLLYVLSTLLLLIRYFQDGKKRDYWFSVGTFALLLFSRDASVFFFGVIAILFFLDPPRKLVGVAKALVPYLGVIVVYLLLRQSKVGSVSFQKSAVYSIHFDFGQVLWTLQAYLFTLFNLPFEPTDSGGVGLTDLVSHSRALRIGFSVIFLLAGLVLSAFTLRPLLTREQRWKWFPLIWIAVSLLPIFLIANRQAYYFAEGVAAFSLLLALASDGRAANDARFASAWKIMLVVLLLNGIGHNSNMGVFHWNVWSKRLARINRLVFVPNRDSHAESLTILSETKDEAFINMYAIEPPFTTGIEKITNDSHGLLRSLLSPEIRAFRSGQTADFKPADCPRTPGRHLYYRYDGKLGTYDKIAGLCP